MTNFSPLDNDSIFVDEEFGKVPKNGSSFFGEEFPQRMRSASVDADLGEEVEGHAVGRSYVFFHFRVRSFASMKDIGK